MTVLAALMFLVICAVPACAETEDFRGTAYEVFVYSFYDSDGDGIGDIQGLRKKLDYINDGDPDTESDLGCSMLWTMPVFPSPTYHKYDVTDYMAVDPEYGTLDDFDDLLEACHERGIKWILDFPVNHTSVEHPWFAEAAAYLSGLSGEKEPSSSECRYIDYYNFSKESAPGWEPLPGTEWFYEARFWSGMPDLNLDNEMVLSEIRDIMAFWLERGADGFRLDAVTSYYTEDNGKSIAFLKWLNDTAKSLNPSCYLVGEAWTDRETYMRFYESGIDSMFDFAFSGAEGVVARVAAGKRDASWYVEKLTEEEAQLAVYDNAVNAPFYTNHDMARSAGYYPRDDGSRAKIAQALNLLMPGNAFLYYGEELGMKGSGKDENKRAPMYWSSDPDAEGICAGPPEMDSVGMKYPSYEEQNEDEYSILSYVRHIIHLKNRYPVIASGTTVPAGGISGEEVCGMFREAEGEERVLLIINTSENTHEIDLRGECGEYTMLAGTVQSSEEEISITDGILTLPPYDIAVLCR